MFILTGCSLSNQSVLREDVCFNTVQLKDGKWQPQYCPTEEATRTYRTDASAIDIPGYLFQFHNTNNVTFDSNPTNDPPTESDFTITIHQQPSQFSCSPAITGASQTQVMEGTNGDTSWGKVDAFDRLPYDFAPGTQPLCRPPVLEWSFFGEMEYKRISDDAAYALCSEKDGKRVLICISQMTDNPQLAEEIFRTFRWGE